jgi:hypothetical protein
MKQTEDFVLVIKNQKWLMLYQKSANTKIVINNRISITNETVGRFCNGKELNMINVVSKGANTKIVIKYQFINQI